MLLELDDDGLSDDELLEEDVPWLELDEEIPGEELDVEEELLELVGVLELEELVGGGGVCEELLELVGSGGVFEELLDEEVGLPKEKVEEVPEDEGLFQDEELLMACLQVVMMSRVRISRRILATTHAI